MKNNELARMSTKRSMKVVGPRDRATQIDNEWSLYGQNRERKRKTRARAGKRRNPGGTEKVRERIAQTLKSETSRPRRPVGAACDGLTVTDRTVGPGYGISTHEVIDAVKRTAGLEGLLLDPVYTGKAMAALFDLVRGGRFNAADQVVFWHTGGAPALFAYRDVF
jgi:hypothetical protein